MKKRFFQLITASIAVLGLNGSAALAQSARVEVPPVPENIQVPEGFTPFLVGHATGTQNYMCLPTNEGPRWKFFAPQATVYQASKGGSYRQIMTHFLAAYPGGYGPAFASWQDSLDSSHVWALKEQESTDAAFVEAGAIAWLRLKVLGSDLGPSGGSRLAETVYIQRLNTSGGNPETAECTTIGALNLVPYSADYFFYRSKSRE